MPPKKTSSAQPSKKTEIKKKEKIIEDKTFGIKNKKGSKQQKFIAQVEKQVKSGGIHPLGQGKDTKKEEKEKKLKEQKELAALFKPVIVQKIDKDADPKSILCAFFKQGQCTKGDKCKFSHDISIERKGEKKSIYVDARDDSKENDTMDNWDEDKLKEVVDKKHASEKTMPATTIICKYFLEAVEKSLYGWFWECPNGTKCIYRHALPQGYVLKKDKKREDKKDEISLEDLIESERASLGPEQTKVTLETFLAWKKRKIEEKKKQMLKDEEKKRTDFKSGKQFGISGREMFSFNPDLVHDQDGDMEDDEVAFDSKIREDTENDAEFREIDFSKLTFIEDVASNSEPNATSGNENQLAEDDPDNIAGPINENLFSEECLEGLDDELEDLDE